MSVTVLPQLVEAEANLSEQETVLMQQLAAIQEKRKGLQTVIAMFESSDNGEPLAAAVTSILEEPIVSDEDEDEDADEDAKAGESEETVAAKLARVMKSKTTSRKSKAAKTSKVKTLKQSTSAKKADGRSARWQRYVRDEYQEQRLPDVVANVLKTKPKDSFKISDVMSAVFEDSMPKTQHLKARSRISNILSAGARDNEWYRGRGGTYSLSKKALKTR
ncbi:MAG: hypothetical protein KTR27_17170 [Leptolyngbyaceae cyanobacterium MAG.088]|nr:hypothetical protein [Leptolyngbyaceae cyanobacterium MAG.088]